MAPPYETLRIPGPPLAKLPFSHRPQSKREFSNESTNMSPGRQRTSDDEVFAAVQRAMTKRGPHELTLADIATEAGVSPGRLVQRYGSKRALLLLLAERFAGSARAVFEVLRATHRHPLATLRAYAVCVADLAPTPEALSRNLAYLQIDLTDPDFRAHLLTNARATRREIESLLRAAVSEGELRRNVDIHGLARAVEAVISGSLMTWACYREGSAATWIRRNLKALLQPYVSGRQKASMARRSARRQPKRRRVPRV
jgi:AcrR family transcriptional regulator